MHVNRHVAAAGMLLAAALLAGCTTPPNMPGNGGSGNGNNDGETGGNGVTVTGPTCLVDGQPCASTEITAFSIPEISVSARNTGKTPVTLQLNKQASQGRQVLTAKCPQYTVKEFRAEISTGAAVNEVTGQQSVTLDPGETLDMTWFMELHSDLATTNRSLSCVFRFNPTFSQRLVTVKQVQVRGSERIQPASTLQYTTTARAPVELIIESDTSVVQDVIGGDVRPLQVKSYLMNRGAGAITSTGYRNGQKRIHLTAAGLPTDCTDRQITVTQGEQTMQQPGILCRITPERIETAQIYEVRAETTYTYERVLPPVELSLGTLEAGG